MDRRVIHRLSRNSLIVLLFFTAIGFALPLFPDLVPADFGFTWAFFIGGLVWLAVAYFSGGFVGTYVAPVGGGRGAALYYANPARSSNLPLAAGPEVMEDLRNKMADQPVHMAVAFVKAMAFFALAAVFYIHPIAGAATLVVVATLFTALFIRSRPRPSTPVKSPLDPKGSQE